MKKMEFNFRLLYKKKRKAHNSLKLEEFLGQLIGLVYNVIIKLTKCLLEATKYNNN